MRTRRGNESGSILVWVMVVGLFTVGALGAMTRLLPAGTRLAERDANTTYALIAAESGINYVAHHLQQFGTGDLENLLKGWTSSGDLGGTFEVVSDGDFIYVTATFGEPPNETTRRLRARVLRERQRVAVDLKAAVFATTDNPTGNQRAIYMQGSPTINGIAGTNATAKDAFYHDWNSKVTERIIVGPGGGPSTVYRPPSMNFTTPIEVLTEKKVFPLPEFPSAFADLPWRGSVTADWNPNEEVIIRESGQYNSITVHNQLAFDTTGGDLHIRVNALTVDSSAKVRVAGDGKVFLYVERTLFLSAGGTFNQGGNTNAATVYYAGTASPKLSGNFKFSGIIYVMNAPVSIGGSFGLQGSLFSGGSYVQISGGAEAGAVDHGVVYAPNAYVEISGGAVTGAVVGDRISMTGGSVTHAAIDLAGLPVRFPADGDAEQEETENLETLEWQVCWTDCISMAEPEVR